MRLPISVVIRTYNEEKFIDRLICNLREQLEYGKSLDIVVVDNDSTDGTRQILKDHSLTIVNITKKEFNYSKALNLGICESKGELIVILSGHAIPSSKDWLVKMSRHFEKEDVAGVYCRQIPWPEADLHEVVRLKKTFGLKSEIFDSSTNLANMHFSNAASCIRRSFWDIHPFVEMPAAEDNEWATYAVRHGYKIVYDTATAVYHSHTEPCRKAARRVIELEKSADVINHRKRTVLLTAKQSLGWFIRDIKEITQVRVSNYQKSIHLFRSAKKCAWYVLDFDRI